MYVNYVINDDWYSGCKLISDGSIDCIIVDPPYKMSPRGATRRTGFDSAFSFVKDNIFNGNLPNKEKMMKEFYRLLVDNGHCYIFCGIYDINPVLEAAFKNGWKLCNILVMHKKNIAIVNSYFMKTNEFVLMFRKKDKPAKKINNCSEKDFIEVVGLTKKDNKLHVTEKPQSILELLINSSTNEGDILLDAFAGSGSLGVACHKLNRNFIGFEIDTEMCDKANERIDRLINKDAIRKMD